MDQLRKAMQWLKQHHFWVLSVLVAIIGLVCWKMAAARLSKEFTDNRGKITSEFEKLNTFRNKPFHANQTINDEQLKQIELQSKNVEAIWKTLYDRQSKGVLTWPEALSPRFRDYVTKHKFDDPIPRDLCENYRDYIERHFESLPKKIGARVLEQGEAGGAGGEGGFRGFGRGSYRDEGGMSSRGLEGAVPGMVATPEDDYICEWLDQGRVRQELNFPTTPSPLKIWVTQENLWVYHTLLNIIANTNNAAHADRISNAAVRTIYSLEVGQPAALATAARGKVEILQGGAVAATGAEGELGLEGDGRGAPADGGALGFSGAPEFSEGRGGYGEGGSGGMSPEQERGMLLAARYVDATGKPLGGGMAASTESVDPSAAAPAAELPTGPFKRLPILMTLEMDQRWLTHLISECASQPLPVEVTEVRISPHDASGAGVMGGEGERFGGEGYGGSGGAVSSHQPGVNLSSGVLTFKQNPHLVTVVIRGIVTIFNEPDPSVLKVGSGEQVAVTQ